MEITNIIGKYLLVYCQGIDIQHPTLILVDRVEDIAGKLFVIGKQPDELFGAGNWLGGIDTYIVWGSVVQFHIFEDYESFMLLYPRVKNYKTPIWKKILLWFKN